MQSETQLVFLEPSRYHTAYSDCTVKDLKQRDEEKDASYRCAYHYTQMNIVAQEDITLEK